MNINYFKSSREVKWCPGCGNYAILKSMQKTLFFLGVKSEKIVFVSGIGCSGRFPYYINTHGFHTLHGRAPAVATGLRLMRSDLIVWIVIGDGDGFSIGLNHILHLVRRNINVNVLFINNKIYALTKGQYSPTSDRGSITKSSPHGSIEESINPLLMILSAGCSFVARTVDNDSKNFSSIIIEAMKHNGTSFIEVLQNCNIFNDGIYSNISNINKENDKLLYLNDKQFLYFGKNNNYCLVISDNLRFKIVSSVLSKDYIIPRHDITTENVLQLMLSKLSYNKSPFPLGIFRCVKKNTYEDNFNNAYILKSKKINKFSDLFL